MISFDPPIRVPREAGASRVGKASGDGCLHGLEARKGEDLQLGDTMRAVLIVVTLVLQNFGSPTSFAGSEPSDNKMNVVSAVTSWGFSSAAKIHGASRFSGNSSYTEESNIRSLLDDACASVPAVCSAAGSPDASNAGLSVIVNQVADTEGPQSVETDSLIALEGRWYLVELPDRQIGSIYFEIHGNEIAGYDGCNSFAGELRPSAEIRIGQRWCVGGTTVFPLDLSNPMPQLEKAQLTGDELILPGGERATILRRDARE